MYILIQYNKYMYRDEGLTEGRGISTHNRPERTANGNAIEKEQGRAVLSRFCPYLPLFCLLFEHCVTVLS